MVFLLCLIVLLEKNSLVLVRRVAVVTVLYLQPAPGGDELGVLEERPEVLQTPSLAGPTIPLALVNNNAIMWHNPRFKSVASLHRRRKAINLQCDSIKSVATAKARYTYAESFVFSRNNSSRRPLRDI
jgi:hypothetical protein